MRLIDADALLLRLGSMIKKITPIEYSREMFYHDTARNGALVGARVEVQIAPTIDAVPVVRCKDCMFWKPTGSEMGDSLEDMEPIGGCRHVKFCRKASDFCSFGESKMETWNNK